NYIFFFQAEDGIRDRNVTGVQTCALPIFVVIKMPQISDTDLKYLIKDEHKDLNTEIIDQIAKFFSDLKTKARAHEISESAPDLRGIFDAIDLVIDSLEYKKNLT